MAHILQIDSKVKEIYLSNSDVGNSKNLLLVYDNDSIVLKWCNGNVIEIQESPTLINIGRRTLIEYGEPNLFGIRRKIPFKNDVGNLESMWEKIM